MWRSLVARLNGVQEAAGSTPVTRTIKTEHTFVCSVFIFEGEARGRLLKGCKKPPNQQVVFYYNLKLFIDCSVDFVNQHTYPRNFADKQDFILLACSSVDNTYDGENKKED